MSELNGYDFDGVTSIGVRLQQPCVIISGRTFSEYDEFIRSFAQDVPMYIRGAGAPGDQQHAGKHKAAIINLLGVRNFYEDDPVQLQIIRDNCPNCKVFLVINAETFVQQN